MNPRKAIFLGVGSAILLTGCIAIGVRNVFAILGIIFATIIGIVIGILVEWVHEEKRMDAWQGNYSKMEAYFRLLSQWLSLKQEGKNLKEYLDFNGYCSVAIYGMSEPGERLIEELEDTDIEIRYVVDRNADNIVTRIPKYKPDDDLPNVDVMIVTAILAFQDIRDEMGKKTSFPIISLEDVIYGLV